MNKPELLLKRLEEIGQSLDRSGKALALMGLGSVGVELERLDEYSDLDFFVLVKDGYKQEFLQNHSWLSEVAPITFAFQDTVDGCKVLYEDNIFCEFAVFEFWELKEIRYSEYRMIWSLETFDDDLIPTKNIVQEEKKSREYLINEALTNLYVGLCRDRRGECSSGFTFIQQCAVDRVMELTAFIYEEQQVYKDKFANERRFEQRFPEMKEYLPLFRQGYAKNRESANEILKFLNRNFEMNSSLKQRIVELIYEV